jgi:hypothetical protein
MADLQSADFLAEDAHVPFYENLGNRNPLYASILGLGVDNNVASKTITDYFNQADTIDSDNYPYDYLYMDPRGAKSFDEASFNSAGLINGIVQGSAAAGGFPSNAPRSSLSKSVLGATVPVILISGYESNLLQAEAIVRGLLTTGDAQDLYEETVITSLMNAGVPDTGISSHPTHPDSISNPITRFMMREYILWPSTQTEQLERIATEKWALMCGFQNMEAWIESRRTGIPAFTPSVASQLGAGLLPQRIPYSADEETANSNFPGQEPLTKKMWWAK